MLAEPGEGLHHHLYHLYVDLKSTQKGSLHLCTDSPTRIFLSLSPWEMRVLQMESSGMRWAMGRQAGGQGCLKPLLLGGPLISVTSALFLIPVPKAGPIFAALCIRKTRLRVNAWTLALNFPCCYSDHFLLEMPWPHTLLAPTPLPLGTAGCSGLGTPHALFPFYRAWGSRAGSTWQPPGLSPPPSTSPGRRTASVGPAPCWYWGEACKYV